jgi:chitodextrinase
VGERVASDCQIHEALVDSPSGRPGSSDDWSVLALSHLLDTWSAGESYEVGDRILFDGVEYEARQAHTAQSDWQPPDVPALWQQPTPEGVPAWTVNTSYVVGSQVTFNGQQYVCIQAHTSLTGWDPVSVPALWQLEN